MCYSLTGKLDNGTELKVDTYKMIDNFLLQPLLFVPLYFIIFNQPTKNINIFNINVRY
jgi:hypothetical protein